MRRAKVLALLAAHKDELKSHHVRSLSIFGSVARDEARPDSDVDCLVDFDAPVGLFAFAVLKLYLEEILGTRVDLATPEALRATMRERILSEAIRAA